MNGRSGIKVRYDKDFEKQCYDLIIVSQRDNVPLDPTDFPSNICCCCFLHDFYW